MKMINTGNPKLLERDAAGNYLLDVPAKAMLLTALKRGAFTESELDTLLDKADKGGIRIIKTPSL